MTKFKITVQQGRIPVVIPIDGVRIEATVTRFTLEQMTAFSKGFQRLNERLSEAQLSIRKPGELERDEHGYRVSADAVRAARLLEMTDAERQAFETRRTEEEAFAVAFITEQLAKHLRLAPGQVFEVQADGTEREITNGADFAEIYGGRHEVLLTALAAIARQRQARPEPPAPAVEDSVPAADASASVDTHVQDTGSPAGH